MDGKRELEKLLKAACEAFIMAVTKAAVEAMLSFLTKVTAVRVARPGAGIPAHSKPLREQARASGSRPPAACTRLGWSLLPPQQAPVRAGHADCRCALLLGACT